MPQSIPQVRVVRKAGQRVAPPKPTHPEGTAFTTHLRNAYNLAMGLWPLTAVVLLLIGLVILATNMQASRYY